MGGYINTYRESYIIINPIYIIILNVLLDTFGSLLSSPSIRSSSPHQSSVGVFPSTRPPPALLVDHFCSIGVVFIIDIFVVVLVVCCCLLFVRNIFFKCIYIYIYLFILYL